MRKLLAGAMFGAVMLGGPAMAAGQDMNAMMAALFPDPDGDGATSKDEMLAASEARFTRLDANKDGRLGADERGAGMGGRMMGRADTDGDGNVSLDEMRAATGQRFDRIDTDHDGKIDKAERDAVSQRVMQRRGNN